MLSYSLYFSLDNNEKELHGQGWLQDGLHAGLFKNPGFSPKTQPSGLNWFKPGLTGFFGLNWGKLKKPLQMPKFWLNRVEFGQIFWNMAYFSELLQIFLLLLISIMRF